VTDGVTDEQFDTAIGDAKFGGQVGQVGLGLVPIGAAGSTWEWATRWSSRWKRIQTQGEAAKFGIDAAVILMAGPGLPCPGLPPGIDTTYANSGTDAWPRSVASSTVQSASITRGGAVGAVDRVRHHGLKAERIPAQVMQEQRCGAAVSGRVVLAAGHAAPSRGRIGAIPSVDGPG
jgi:hypothetical protein